MPQSDFWPFKSKTTEDACVSGASVLQKQLGDMESEVKEIQMELETIRKDRQNLHPRINSIGRVDEEVVKDTTEDNYLKMVEVSKLREDLIRAKNAADEEKFKREKYETQLRDLEGKLNGLCCAGLNSIPEVKELRKIADGEVLNLKSQIRDLKEELEETKLTLNEKSDELQDYRVKYLHAQQQVEELRRQQEVMDFENKQVSEQVQLEIQKMKMQFQEKLHELAPLPDLLKGAQIELQEAKQLQRLAEDSSMQLSNELQRVKEKLVLAINCMNKEKAEKLQAVEENKQMKINLEETQNECESLNVHLDDHKCSVLRLQEKLTQQENRFKEKSLECAELLKDLDELRQETKRSLSRSKERADSMRRYLQMQIAELERQLVQTRAQCRASIKERDEVRQRMQVQLSNLQENFELVELRLRTLQGQVTSLKTSYAVILAGDDEHQYEFSKITT
ncbi:hypothetical protein O0L34_g2494 [Tuta absoluta]|nr:hypothetical protein O0L34_g2494 [Tuta absoluta]